MKTKICNIEIKGKKYTVYKIPKNEEFFGRIIPSEKKIELSDEQLKETIFHELSHGYFYECGAMRYCDDEDLQTTIARNAKEMFKNYGIILKAYNKLKKQPKGKKKIKKIK